jgi:hypothetical protein
MSSHPLHNKSAVKRPQLSDWAWRPWYAKLWWSLIAAYWTGGAGAFLFHPVADFYTSRFAGYLGIALYPVFALAILSIGWVRAWVGALDYAAENPEIENTLGWEWSTEPDALRNKLRSRNDPSDPTSPSSIANATARCVFDR